MKQATLCLLIKENEILLAMKKRGFGVGKYNGVGGKVADDESIEAAAVRETKEEIGVDIKNLEKVGVLHFHFPYKTEWDQDVHLFLAKSWEGEVKESEEMAPKWFKKNKIPYGKMWDDDKHWLPHILSGKKLEAKFVFKEAEKIDKFDIKIVEEI